MDSNNRRGSILKGHRSLYYFRYCENSSCKQSQDCELAGISDMHDTRWGVVARQAYPDWWGPVSSCGYSVCSYRAYPSCYKGLNVSLSIVNNLEISTTGGTVGDWILYTRGRRLFIKLSLENWWYEKKIFADVLGTLLKDYFLGNCILVFWILNPNWYHILGRALLMYKKTCYHLDFGTYWLTVRIKMSWDLGKVLNLILLFALLVGW